MAMVVLPSTESMFHFFFQLTRKYDFTFQLEMGLHQSVTQMARILLKQVTSSFGKFHGHVNGREKYIKGRFVFQSASRVNL